MEEQIANAVLPWCGICSESLYTMLDVPIECLDQAILLWIIDSSAQMSDVATLEEACEFRTGELGTIVADQLTRVAIV